MIDQPFYTIAEIAKWLRVCQTTVRNMIKSGRLKAVSYGTTKGSQRSHWRISKEAVDEFVSH